MIDIPDELFDNWWNSMEFVDANEDEGGLVILDAEPIDELDRAIELAEILGEEKVVRYLQDMKEVERTSEQ